MSGNFPASLAHRAERQNFFEEYTLNANNNNNNNNNNNVSATEHDEP
jgi:hypothetical protein